MIVTGEGLSLKARC